MHLLTIVPTYDDVFLTVAREYTHISIQSINKSIKNFIKNKVFDWFIDWLNTDMRVFACNSKENIIMQSTV
jgi:valyl-tRNA synthetase